MIKCDACGKRQKVGNMIYSVTTYYIGESLSPESTEEFCYDCYQAMNNAAAKIREELSKKKRG